MGGNAICTVTQFLWHLHDAQIVHLLHKPNKGVSQLQKPAKIYFENTCFAFALQPSPNVGTIREVFFINQLKNAGKTVGLGDKGDFLVDGTWTFEVGGKNKGQAQIREVENSYLALDDMEHGLGNKIPLWLFGFLY